MKLVVLLLVITLTVRAEALDFWENRKINCGVSVWSDWYELAPNGTRSRSRTVIRQPRNGGSSCPPLTETQGADSPRERVSIRPLLPAGVHGYSRPTGGGIEFTLFPRDLLFIIDMSGGISRKEWAATKHKLAELIGRFCGSIGPGRQNNRIAIITFSSRVILNFDFKTHWTIKGVRRAILNMRQERSRTCTGDALVFAHKYLFEPNTGVRSATESVKEVLVLTDGYTNCGAELTINLRRLQVKAFVFALAIGGSRYGPSGITEIKSMASKPFLDHIFSQANFLDFSRMVYAMRGYPGECVPFELT